MTHHARIHAACRAATLATCLALLVAPLRAEEPALTYPETRKSDDVDTYHGVRVADPYRWLEDDNSAETKAWVAAQNKTTFAYLKSLPNRDALERRQQRQVDG